MRFWEITRKDLLLLSRDRRAVVVLIAFPMVFIWIIGLTMGQLLGWKAENKLLTIGYVDRVDYEKIEATGGETARKEAHNIVIKMLNRVQEQEGMRVEPIPLDADYKQVVDERELTAALIIGPDFYDKVKALDLKDVIATDEGALAGGLGSLDMEVFMEGSEESSTRSVIEALVFGSAQQTSFPYVACSHRTKDIATNAEIRRRCADLEAELKPEVPPVELKPPQEVADVTRNRVYQEVIPSYTVMFVFFLVNVMARSFIHERELGTLRRLRIAPLSRTSLLVGKTVPFLVISLVQTALLFLFGKVFFGMWWGHQPWLILPIAFATSLAATALGLLVATLVRTESQVSAYANIVVIGMAGISGCFMPRDWLPKLTQQISLATPHAWSLIAYDQVLRKEIPDLATVMQGSLMLLGFAAVFFALGCWRFGRGD